MIRNIPASDNPRIYNVQPIENYVEMWNSSPLQGSLQKHTETDWYKSKTQKQSCT